MRIQSLANFSADVLQNKFLPSLTPLQSKIIMVVAAVFVSLAALFLVSHYCYRKKHAEIKTGEKKEIIEKPKTEIEDLTKSVVEKEGTQEAKKEEPSKASTLDDCEPKAPDYDCEVEPVEPDSEQKKISEEDAPFVPRGRPNLFDTFVPPANFTAEETACARDVIGTWMHTRYPCGYAFDCPGMQMRLVELERRKKVMNYLLKEGFFEAWGFSGGIGIPIVKTFLTDKCPPEMIRPYTWRTRKTLEDERKFKERNWIDLSRFTTDELKGAFPEAMHRSLFYKVVKDLNTRVNNRPHPIDNTGEERPILEFLLKKKRISKFEDKEYKYPNDTVYQFDIYSI